jgi:hypothetical protein
MLKRLTYAQSNADMPNRLTLAFVIVGAATISACRSPAIDGRAVAAPQQPYPHSRRVTAVTWDFATETRRALGSDLWPCTWARDDAQYCAWGDGGGFDGNDDHIGRVSLGFARITGFPVTPLAAKNVWGAPPYAEHEATFGGKVLSLISIDGVLYAIGGFWTSDDVPVPTQRGDIGPFLSLAWSSDLGASWQMASWSTPSNLGTFLNFGRDNAGAIDSYVYIYYVRKDDTKHIFLKRVLKDQLRSDPSVPGLYQYLSRKDGRTWSTSEADAVAVFFDANNLYCPDVVYDGQLRRYLMTVGHYRSGNPDDSSPGEFGIFEGASPWGPWSTIAYYDDWGDYRRTGGREYLGVHMPNKWTSDGGKTRWIVFSGVHELDSFNLVRARFTVHRWLDWLSAIFRHG